MLYEERMCEGINLNPQILFRKGFGARWWPLRRIPGYGLNPSFKEQ